MIVKRFGWVVGWKDEGRKEGDGGCLVSPFETERDRQMCVNSWKRLHFLPPFEVMGMISRSLFLVWDIDIKMWCEGSFY